MPALEERINNGAAWLDKNAPGWLAKVRLDELNMRRWCSCVAGFAFDISAAEPVIVPALLTELVFNDKLCAHGFDVDTGEYDELTEAWRSYILERRELSCG